MARMPSHRPETLRHIRAAQQQAKDATYNISDAQFRENIRQDVARKTRIMFGEI